MYSQYIFISISWYKTIPNQYRLAIRAYSDINFSTTGWCRLMSSLEPGQLLHIFRLPYSTKWKQRTQGKYMVHDKATDKNNKCISHWPPSLHWAWVNIKTTCPTSFWSTREFIKATKYFSHSVTSTIFPLHKERHLSGHYQTYIKSYHLMPTK